VSPDSVAPPPVVDEIGTASTSPLRAVFAAVSRWESALVLLLIATMLYGAHVSPAFMHSINFFYTGVNVGEIAIMALPLALIIMTGEIDLSIAATLGLSGALVGVLFEHGWSIEAAITAALVLGVVTGLFNGFLVTKLGLPSLAVTIGTLALYRGIAQIILPNGTLKTFPPSLTKIGIEPIPHTQIPYSIGFFAVLAVIFGVVLHATPLGRSIYAIGANQEAAFFSGIRVKRIKLMLFVVSGFLSALAGVLLTLRYASARYDAGTGLELNVVTVVLLGGVSIFGGRGTIIGVVLAVCVLGGLQDAMTLANIAGQEQNIVVGGLLLASVILPNVPGMLRRLKERRRGAGARRALRAETSTGA
jgi:rhamnose transport system permease protein